MTNIISNQPQFVVVLPYYCDEEIKRFLRLADWLRESPADRDGLSFVLAASPRANESKVLLDAYSCVAPTRSFQCPTQVFGYPEGPTAMFWDAMDYVAEHFSGDGFSLWFESDMAFAKPDWLTRLRREWFGGEQQPLVMGCYVPRVYKKKFLRRRKLMLEQHINGGACYSLDFARRMPSAARVGVFDMKVFEYGQQVGTIKTTSQISFSTVSSARRDLIHPAKTILHGFMENKDQFIEKCVKPISADEMRQSSWHPLLNAIDNCKRRIRLILVRGGKRATLDSVLLAQQRSGLR